MFEHLERWTKERRVYRLELTVVTLNAAGLSLYKIQEFEIEGDEKEFIIY